jgi:hypothetical protein
MGITEHSWLRHRTSRICVALVLPVCILLTLSVLSVSAKNPALSEQPQPEISVVMIVLDEAMLSPLLRVDGTINRKRFPGFAALADTSTWYRNMMGTSQRTTEAVPSILSGQWPSLKKYPVLRDHPNNLFTYMRGRKELNVYQSITKLCPRGVCPNAGPEYFRMVNRQVQKFEEFIEESASSTVPTLHFTHLLLPHRPWGLAPDVRLSPDLVQFTDKRSERLVDRRRDNYQSMLRQYVATDTLLLEFINKLKASPRWDNTMIVVTADHGITFVPGESYRDKINIKNPGTLEDIYRVPLFIKYPQQTKSSISDCPASSIDILPTIISTNGVAPTWTTEGVNLRDICPLRTSRRVQWPYSTTQISTDFSAVLERVRYYDNWIDANGDVDDIYRVRLSGRLLGKKVPDTAPKNVRVSWTLNGDENYQNVGTGRLAPVPTRASGTLTTQSRLCERCEGLIAANGRFVGVLPELAGMTAEMGSLPFSSSLMSRYIQPGDNRVELWVADWTSQKPVMSLVGVPNPGRVADLNGGR